MLPSVAEQRDALRRITLEADRRHRILFVGSGGAGPTGVVLSLGRALERLGHTVFHVDTNVHPHTVVDGSGALGGPPPRYLAVEALTPILDRFAPQIVVVCGGAVVLAEDAAARLRARGAVILGMTLDDPDVLPSVAEHAGRFDYHTTNALDALGRYATAGLRNTTVFPFGIDLDYVVRDVAPDPDLRADVICIGHALGHTERNDVMRALARRFAVRVYGHGWRFPGAVPLAGDRLIQAARAAPFHVNFPRTRAGHTIVEAGVFESVGAGAVVCTSVSGEMKQFFDYGTEIVGYDDAEQLADEIAALLAAPERLEAMRRAAFHRLITSHLYEHRWLELFEWISADVASPEPVVGRERATEIRAVLAKEQPPARTVLVSGYFGARNRGDDILLDAVADGIARHVPDAHVVVAATGAQVVEARHGLRAFDRLDAKQSDHWAARASALVLGPGGLWHDYHTLRAGGVAGVVNGAKSSPAHLTQLPAMVAAHGGAVHVFGMGVGPIRDEATAAVVRLAGRLADSVVVRDDASRELLEAISGWTTPVERAADLAYAAPLPDAEATPETPSLVVNVRPWTLGDAGLDAIRDAVTAVARERGLTIVGLPMQPPDEEALRQLFGEITVVPCDTAWSTFVATLGGASAVVAMRLHASVIAHRLRRPAVGLAYDPKVTAHYAELGRDSHVVGLPATSDAIAERIRAALDEQQLSDETHARVRALEQSADDALRRLGERLRATSPKMPPPGMVANATTTDALLPPGWSPAERLDLLGATMTSGNPEQPGRDVAYAHGVDDGGVHFHLADSGPRRGDFVEWTLPVAAEPGTPLKIELVLRQRYPERKARRGRLAWQVRVEGVPLFRVDCAAWQERTSVWIACTPPVDRVEVAVRIEVLRDCEAWNWGRATAMVIEAARVKPWDGDGELRWGASCPVTEVVASESAPEPSRKRRWLRG